MLCFSVWGPNQTPGALFGMMRSGAELDQKKNAPEIQFGSVGYYDYAWKIYLGLWLSEPTTVLKIYAVKFKKIMNLPFTFVGVKVSHVGFLIVAMLPWIMFTSRKKYGRSVWVQLPVSLIFIFCF